MKLSFNVEMLSVTKQNKHDHLKKEWSTLFKQSIRISRKKKRAVKKKLNEKRKEEEDRIKEWHELHYKRNDSSDDFDEFQMASMDPPPGAWETLG